METINSRNSDFDGYWIFGLLFHQLDGMCIDLVRTDHDVAEDLAIVWFASEARKKMKEQIEKGHLTMDCVQAASLEIKTIAESATGSIHGRPCSGSIFCITALVVTDLGTEYRRDKQIFVAPHNPSVEHRSTRRLPKRPAIYFPPRLDAGPARGA
ncbi:MAG: hypothetical protein ACREIA_01430 [Opitutaceae bacterium]